MQSFGYADGFETRTDRSAVRRDDDSADRIREPTSLSFNLRELNRAFLGLLVDAEASSVGVTPGASLPDAIIRPLRRLAATELAAIADCPYTLFDLKFDDTQVWQRIFASRFEFVAAPPVESNSIDLVRSILYFVWYAARTDDTFIRCAFGMPAPVAAQFAELSAFSVTKIIQPVWSLMSPRWPHHARFWPDLVRFAPVHASIQLQASRLLGCQLLAASSMKHGTYRKTGTPKK